MPKKSILRGLILFICGLLTGILIPIFSGSGLMGLPTPLKPTKNSDGSEMDNRQPTSVDLVHLYPRLIKRQGNPKTTYLALTFDDGPDLLYTPKILDILKKYKVKATFFVIGTQIKKYPRVFKRMISEGHEIGVHGYQHLKISNLPAAKINYQLSESKKLIQKYGYRKRTNYRPPYGAITPKAVEAIGNQGYKIVLWTIDSLDWRSIKKHQVFNNVIPKLKNGYIILQHNAAESRRENLSGSVAALPGIIETAQKRGYRFITVSTMLK